MGRLDPNRTDRIGALLTGSPHVTVDSAAWCVVARAALPATLRRPGIMTWTLPLAFSVGGFVILRLRRPAATGCRDAAKTWAQ